MNSLYGDDTVVSVRQIAYIKTKENSLPESFLRYCSKVTPLVEPVKTGQVFLDLSGCGNSQEILLELARKIYPEISRPLEIGLASSKLIACIAADDLKKHAKKTSSHSYRHMELKEIKMLD